MKPPVLNPHPGVTNLAASCDGARPAVFCQSRASAQAGFSLIELMIVVAIIGILGTIAVPNFSRMVDKARIGSSKATMASVRTVVMGLRVADEKTLPEITGTMSTAFYLNGRADGTDPINWNAAGGNPSWSILGFPETPRDPWGRIFILDENEMENGPADCRYDVIFSAGPDKIYSGSGDGDDVFNDDVIMRVPHYASRGCPGNNLYGQFGGN